MSWSASAGWLCKERIPGRFVDGPALGGVVGLPAAEQQSLRMPRSWRAGLGETWWS